MDPPFKCTNEGWGEFEMTIDLFTTEKGGKQTIPHDLNFAAAQYENEHTITFKNPSQALQQILRETGPLPSDEERKLKKVDGGKKKKTFDVEKMADGLIKLGEDDLLQVIQMVHDHKDDNTFVQNNIDAGEFSVDLYTLPDNLLKLLWEFLVRPISTLFLVWGLGRGGFSWCLSVADVAITHLGQAERRRCLRKTATTSAFNGVWRTGDGGARSWEKHWSDG